MGGMFWRIRRRKRRAPAPALYRAHKEEARALVHARLAHWLAAHPFQFNQVRIKNNRRTWGSCSSRKNLNFNWRLLTLPAELADYVIIHELCHTVHMDHSRDFWGLVGTFLPDYRRLRAELRRHDLDAARLI